jgi:hypothetical protein
MSSCAIADYRPVLIMAVHDPTRWWDQFTWWQVVFRTGLTLISFQSKRIEERFFRIINDEPLSNATLSRSLIPNVHFIPFATRSKSPLHWHMSLSSSTFILTKFLPSISHLCRRGRWDAPFHHIDTGHSDHHCSPGNVTDVSKSGSSIAVGGQSLYLLTVERVEMSCLVCLVRGLFDSASKRMIFWVE